MTTITEFLLARIAEDEAEAVWASASVGDRDWPHDYKAETGRGVVRTTTHVRVSESVAYRHIARHDPARVLAEVAAKRAIVERHVARIELRDENGRLAHRYDPALSMLLKDDRYVLSHLAAVYADHPDYREEWRP